MRPDDGSIDDDGFEIGVLPMQRKWLPHPRPGPTPEALPYAVPFAEGWREIGHGVPVRAIHTIASMNCCDLRLFELEKP